MALVVGLPGREAEGLTNTDDSRRLHRRIIQDALSHIFVQMCAVVVRFDSIPLGVVCICVESVQMGADSLHGLEILRMLSAKMRRAAKVSSHLNRSCSSLERLVHQALRLPCCLVGHR